MLYTKLVSIDKAKKAVAVSFYEEVYWDVYDRHKNLLKPSFNKDTILYFEKIHQMCKLVGCYDKHSLRHAFFLSLFLGQYCVIDVLYLFRLESTNLDKYFLEHIDMNDFGIIVEKLLNRKIEFTMEYFDYLFQEKNENHILKYLYQLKNYHGNIIKDDIHIESNLKISWNKNITGKEVDFNEFKKNALRFGRFYQVDNRKAILNKDIGL
ncbi:MAG TPA: hypothetical protein EYG82_08370 [Sulfurovum sp.]|nr:hypothetical protein [Sulfurovum sp.]